METRINYTLVGLFVLLVGAMAVIVPLWLTSGLNQQQYYTYTVYMNEAVDGLSTNSAVKYNGVDVGYVHDIRLNPANTQQVKLLINIKQGTPITTNTSATLQSQGVTGVEYIGLKGGPIENARPLIPSTSDPYPEIKVRPSIKLRLDASVTQLMTNLNKMSKQMDLFFNEQNAVSFQQSLKNIDALTATLAKDSGQVDRSMQSFTQLTQSLNQSAQNLPDMTAQMQQILKNLQAITVTIKNNPGVLIRGETPPVLGPGENKG